MPKAPKEDVDRGDGSAHSRHLTQREHRERRRHPGQNASDTRIEENRQAVIDAANASLRNAGSANRRGTPPEAIYSSLGESNDVSASSTAPGPSRGAIDRTAVAAERRKFTVDADAERKIRNNIFPLDERVPTALKEDIYRTLCLVVEEYGLQTALRFTYVYVENGSTTYKTHSRHCECPEYSPQRLKEDIAWLQNAYIKDGDQRAA